jgi:3-dehydroquinate synthase
MICEKMIQLDSKRNTILVSIGGGIIQDITGFVANVLYRGIKWIYIPTTLLAMCDSCIGGKSSLNFKHYKNLLGSFYPPDDIMIYLDFLKTLSLSDYYSGLGEVVKFNVIAGEAEIAKIEEKMESLLARNNHELSEFVVESLKFKKKYIEEDEFDKGKRIFLNFAHTFGHAFESTSLYQIPHGTAVVLGMIVANSISLQRKLLDEKLTLSIESICKKILNIKIKKEWFEINAVINAIKKDKKQTNLSIKAILLNRDFSLGIYNDISIIEITKAIDHLIEIMCLPDE